MSFPSVNSNHNTGAQASGSTSFVVTVPPHDEGDVLYIAIAQDGAATMTQASFTALYDNISIGAGTATFCLFRRTATASEPATYTVTTTLSERAAWIAFAVSNDGGVDSQATTATGTGTTASVNTVTTTQDDCLGIAVFATDLVSTPMSAMSSHTKLDESSVTSGASVGVYYRELITAGANGGGNITLNASEEWVGVRFAIAPGAFVPPDPPAVAVATVQRIRTYLP